MRHGASDRRSSAAGPRPTRDEHRCSFFVGRQRINHIGSVCADRRSKHMPRPDPLIAADGETAFTNLEKILLEHQSNPELGRCFYDTPAFERAMLAAHMLQRLVRASR